MKLPAAITMSLQAFKQSTAAAPRLGAVFATCLSVALVAVAAVALTVAPAKADLTPPPTGDSGSDPTVGTLPSLGNSQFDALDQTLTLRGTYADLRDAVASASGNGAVEAIFLGENEFGEDEYWMRYYGDVQLELDLAALTNLEVSIFTGFEGNGLTYSVGQANGFGEPRQMGVGGDIRLDLLRFKLTGLLDDTLFVAGLHQNGARTMTSMDFHPVDGTVVIRQDI